MTENGCPMIVGLDTPSSHDNTIIATVNVTDQCASASDSNPSDSDDAIDVDREFFFRFDLRLFCLRFVRFPVDPKADEPENFGEANNNEQFSGKENEDPEIITCVVGSSSCGE